MKIIRKSAEKDDTYCAYKEGKATVTSMFEIAKDLEFDRITVGPWQKAAGYSRANTSHRADARPRCHTHSDGHTLCRV